MPTLLLFGDTERSASLRHEIPLAIGDPLMFIEHDGTRYVLTSRLERARIESALPEIEILDYHDFGMRDLREAGMSYSEAEREVAARVMRHLGIDQATIPGEFPVGVADRLRSEDVALTIDDGVFAARRRVKQGRELEGIRIAQRAAEAGMRAAASVLAQAEPGADGRLHLDGQELTAERIRDALRDACAAAGAPAPPDVMVSSLWAGFGHDPGSGPLPAALPIQIDVWPRHEASACWADMTRTFVVGDPTPEHDALIAEQEGLVRGVLEEVRAAVRPGVIGRQLFDLTCDRFEAAGYRTQRTGPGEDPTEGFQFSLGHGVGLEVHEDPSLGLGGHDPLVPGDVIAVEPGLYDHRIGGVRFEDLLLMTDDGSETLTDYPYGLTP